MMGDDEEVKFAKAVVNNGLGEISQEQRWGRAIRVNCTNLGSTLK